MISDHDEDDNDNDKENNDEDDNDDDQTWLRCPWRGGRGKEIHRCRRWKFKSFGSFWFGLDLVD